MAQQKLNRFHWHMTDDEGWHIEIKKYPLLTKVGAKRGPGTKLPFSVFPAMRGPKNRVQSGYYIQNDIREIVAYAKARSIEILPEIDMPGHSKAAVTAIPSWYRYSTSTSTSSTSEAKKNRGIPGPHRSVQGKPTASTPEVPAISRVYRPASGRKPCSMNA